MHREDPEIRREDILLLKDRHFHPDHVCIVMGAASGIGRATAIAAAANNLMTVGLDADEKEGNRTQRIAREMGGQMIFIEADPSRENDLEYAVNEAAKLGSIKFLANIAGMPPQNNGDGLTLARYDHMQRIVLRTSLHLAGLCIGHMERSGDKTGVIGSIALESDRFCTVGEPALYMAGCGLKALTRSIAAAGKGRIRAFVVSAGPSGTVFHPGRGQDRRKRRRDRPTHPPKGNATGTWDMPASMEAANLFIFGFSRFARLLIAGGLVFEGATGKI